MLWRSNCTVNPKKTSTDFRPIRGRFEAQVRPTLEVAPKRILRGINRYLTARNFGEHRSPRDLLLNCAKLLVSAPNFSFARNLLAWARETHLSRSRSLARPFAESCECAKPQLVKVSAKIRTVTVTVQARRTARRASGPVTLLDASVFDSVNARLQLHIGFDFPFRLGSQAVCDGAKGTEGAAWWKLIQLK